MRDPNRLEPILQLIRDIWYTSPDLRLTQLIMNALNINYDPYYVEDEELKEALERYKKLQRNSEEVIHIDPTS